MADQKISELNAITGANVDDANDELAIVDADASETKRITRAELFKGIDGNVGIGESSPNQKLDVAGNIVLSGQSTDPQFVRVGTGRTDNGFSFIDFVGDTTHIAYGLRVIRNNSGPDTLSQILHKGTGGLRLNAEDAGFVSVLTDGSERMRVTSTGDVGIGTSTPAHQFEVENSTGSAIIAATSSVTGTTQIRMGDTANTGAGRIEYDNSANAMSLHTAGNERVTITSAGDVGIGTTSPGSKLSVVGLPTSSAGLSAGDIWNDSGTLKIVT